jgi:peptidoglycan/LPS O-acetylase OafA/YrhL
VASHTVASARPPARAATGASHDLRRHRPDIEGLRALAVGLVVAYHAGVPGLAGGYVGVDVFFVISGFLITGLLLEEIQRRGTLSFAGFYARRARRLLPMATVVLTATAVVFSLVLLPIDRGGLMRDIWAAALYAANWHFAAASLVYGTDASVNPVLHYWSLSVEEQFYLVWPVALFVVTRGARRTPGSGLVVRRVVIALSAIAVVSFGLSVALTPRSAPYSYYGLHTRAWELAAGGLLAVAAGRVRRGLPAAARVAMGWAGLAGVAVAAVVFSGETVFPGVAAALPVGGALLILAAGAPGSPPFRWGVARVLSLRPVTYAGRISYSLYLWHWPCLILLGTLASGDRSTFSVAHGSSAAVAVVLAVGLSVVSHHVIENPVRLSTWMRPSRRSLTVGAATMAVTVAAAALLLPASQGAIRGLVLADVAPLPAGSAVAGGAALGSGAVRVTLAMTPGQARADLPKGTGDCYGSEPATAAPARCEFGDSAGTVTVALVGDSHAEALFPALDAVATANHWRLWLWAKPACPFIALAVRLPQFDNSYAACSAWRRNVLSRLDAMPRLDAVFVTGYGGVASIPGRFAVTGGTPLSAARLPAAWQRAWATTDRELTAVGHRVVVIRDTPQPVDDVPDCLESHVPDETACSIPRAAAMRNADTLYRAERPVSTAVTHFVDVDAALCPGSRCPVVTAGGDIIYRDDEHLTATVSAQLAPMLAAQLKGVLPTSRQ